MAGVPLSDTQDRANFFQQTILNNLRYWQAWLQANQANVSAMDRERTNMVRAISYAYNFEPCWPLVLELVQTLSPFMERRGHWESWNWALTRAVKTAARLGDTSAQVTLSILLARLLFQQSRPKESTHYYRRAIRLARQMGDQFNEARACSNLGYHFIEHGQWHRAEVLCCHALTLFEALDSDHGRAHTENHLGVLYTRQHRWQKAQHHLEQACNIWQAMDDDHGLMRGYLNLGLLYIDAEQPSQALSYLEKALQLAQQTGENIDIGIIHTNMGKAYRLLEDWEKAEEYTKQAEAIFQSYSNLAELSRAWNGLGLIYCRQDRWDEAISYLEKSLDVWRSLGIKFEEVELLLDIGECELLRGNRTEAATRLQEIEHLIGSDPERGPYRHFQPRLEKYRRDLTERKQQNSPQPAHDCN